MGSSAHGVIRGMEYAVYSLEHDDFLYRRHNRLIRFAWGKFGGDEVMEILKPLGEKDQSVEFLLYCEAVGLQSELDAQDQTLKFAESINNVEYHRIPKDLEQTVFVAIVDNDPNFDVSYTYWELFEYGVLS